MERTGKNIFSVFNPWDQISLEKSNKSYQNINKHSSSIGPMTEETDYT
jgi:hypothetical protein